MINSIVVADSSAKGQLRTVPNSHNIKKIKTGHKAFKMKKRKPIIAERIVKLEDADRSWDIKFWKRAGAKARFSATWQMIDEFYKMRGKNGIKRRLQRTVQNIQQI